MSFKATIAVLTQYVIPKQLITTLAGKFASAECGKLTTVVIEWFIQRYQVNMGEALVEDVTHYRTFNAFFTRALKPSARPLANADYICPVDGAISQFGDIRANQLFQAKGHTYTTQTLLANNQTLASQFENGHFATLYLSPKDYHRIHMPCDGTLKSMTYVPGDLFSVNPTTAEGVPNLFARNERVICAFESPHGPFVLILVGATIVGSMATTWHGVVNPPRTGKIKTYTYEHNAPTFKQGEEMGQFLLGSTVVMLFPKNTFAFNASWSPKKQIRLGESMGNRITP